MKKLISFLLRFIPRTYLQAASPIASKIFTFVYKGDNVQCPVCDIQLKKFMPYGRAENARENALCPNCLSLERHRLMWLFLQKKTDFFTAEANLLHIAPEQCFLKPFEDLKNLDYITADLESPWAKVKMDIHDMPFEDNSFDICFCNHVLEHVEDDAKALSEIKRVLKPSGWAIMQSPIDPKRDTTYEDPTITSPREREKHFGQDDHFRIFGNDYDEYLRKNGFTVEPDRLVMEMDPALVARYALPKSELIYLSKK